MGEAMSVFRRLAFACLVLAGLGFQNSARDDRIPQAILVKRNPLTSTSAVLTRARDNFQDNCLPCHGSEGKGDGPLAVSLETKPKDLTSAKIISELTDGEIFWTITKGRKPMPAFDQKLTDEERWGLVHFVRDISHTKPNTTVKSSGQGGAKQPTETSLSAGSKPVTDHRK